MYRNRRIDSGGFVFHSGLINPGCCPQVFALAAGIGDNVLYPPASMIVLLLARTVSDFFCSH
jgi:hypothetical protein